MFAFPQVDDKPPVAAANHGLRKSFDRAAAKEGSTSFNTDPNLILKAGSAEELAADEQVRRVYLGQNFVLRRKDFMKPQKVPLK